MAYNPNMYLPYQPSYTQGYGTAFPTYYPTQPTAQPMNGLVSVTGIEGARAYQMPPNSSMPLFDGNEDVLYVKTTDAAGYPTIRTFRFEPAEPIDVRPVQADYVPRSEFDALVEEVKSLSQPKSRTAGKAATDGE